MLIGVGVAITVAVVLVIVLLGGGKEKTTKAGPSPSRRQPTPSPAASPGPTVTSSPSLGPFPDAAEQVALTWIPPAIASTCARQEAAVPGEDAALQCASGTTLVQYEHFRDGDAQQAAYDTFRGDVAEGSGSSCTAPPFEGTWHFNDQPDSPAGRYLCRLELGNATITDRYDRALLVVRIIRPDGDMNAALQVFENGDTLESPSTGTPPAPSGPSGATGTAAPFPDPAEKEALRWVPGSIASRCVRSKASRAPGEDAELYCQTSKVLFYYEHFATLDAAKARYNDLLRSDGVNLGVGTGCPNVPSEGIWFFSANPNVSQGRYACFHTKNGHSYIADLYDRARLVIDMVWLQTGFHDAALLRVWRQGIAFPKPK